jgi:hypothetical protein
MIKCTNSVSPRTSREILAREGRLALSSEVFGAATRVTSVRARHDSSKTPQVSNILIRTPMKTMHSGPTEDDIDGCDVEIELPTRDDELPPATGGVEDE